MDATIVAAAKQRSSDTEKAQIKTGKVPHQRQKKPAKLRQKDRDALNCEVTKATDDGRETRSSATLRSRLRLQVHASIDLRHRSPSMSRAERPCAENSTARSSSASVRALRMRADLGAKRLVPARNPTTTLLSSTPQGRDLFAKLKDCRRIATRSDTCAHTFVAGSASQATVTCGSDQWVLSRDLP
ncbi:MULTISPECIES: hypothetical protein [unclassified Mesorhizobium]|uniref:hypothetical protein n=1 Tax=unclassified Mesorhizobium TaxID=325217 RepID=UPI000FCC7B16|nr:MULTISPECIES: hypothetical protein [unclassified Mesorhizobium]RUU67850.1 hypothetical protein EOC99_01600 [Mesorhizobium sp. M7A.T.Ca.TU.009.01.1.1]RUU91246.1 hypothetical protein EOD03_00020 [Mesorhizobium sp. M7A.T.Ca.TU.009.01.1.2]RUX05332.1 hypothetical protein EOA35_08030 [Mesorhizobium sp. M8A.F.Ca.ET.023.01.1.1]RVD62090.1 hypothetical protein EN746_00415 [Mesorhizobium sp. M8A.F.Ca.ET.023.02.2.1]TGR36772.1 hypothetical protein EN842_52950 [bacterium M00.F.Ca.ET.199.01.1.1]TGU17396.